MCVTSRRRRSITLTSKGLASLQLLKPASVVSSSSASSTFTSSTVCATGPSTEKAAEFPVAVPSAAPESVPSSMITTRPTTKRSNSNSGRDRRRRVIHVYHDHATDAPSIIPHITRGGVKTPFPIRLHNMLSGVEAHGLTHIVSWQPHGRSFLVHKPQEFADHIMPQYFNQGKFASFQRQLNLYGYKRLTRGPDTGSYYNELFLKGRPFLAQDIQRTKVKGNGARAASNPEAEPNFYAMPTLDDASTSPLPPSAPPSVVVSNLIHKEQPVVSSEEAEWDSTADYLLDVLDDVLDSNMDMLDNANAAAAAAAAPQPAPNSRGEHLMLPPADSTQMTTATKPEISTSAPVVGPPLVSDDEESPAFYADDTLDNILAGVDLDSDFELGMILEKMVSDE
eukprot:CAMPEP_0197719070 /NCGR_PEP_ID=MMETSP1434-20131217/2971_1 /TAXON_ID=265543 /ORGANISM="Minutocellus polymorphus, Strain CCMP3303" /LENGTH=394 /DNA_ID=CAMNT_0043303783 /DNA_START=124 /DNA_END=1308 /DNA_ORIENTATION=+